MAKSSKAPGVVAGEFRRLSRSKMAMLSIVGLMVIPLLYSGMLIGAFWDPYGKLGDLPVAVVNEDAGATMKDRQLAIGSDLVDELKKKDDFKWAFTNAKDAMEGLKDHRYSLAFVIPEDFSKKTATLQDETPQQADIQYYVDDGWNYLTSRIGEQASEKLKTDVAHEVTKAYADAVFSSVGEAANGFGEASDGASKLADGAKDAKDGAQQLHDNLAKLADGTIKLQQGVGQLAGGAASLTSGAQSAAKGAASLADGLKQLGAGEAQLEAGAAQADAAAGQVAAGAGKLAESGKTLAAGAEQTQTGVAAVADGAGKLAAGLKQYAEAHKDDADAAALQQLLASAQAVAAGAEQAHQGAAAVADGAGKLSAGQQDLASGAAQLQAGTAKLRQGLGTFGAKLGAAQIGASDLAAGAGKLAAGAGTLQQGLTDAGKGVGTVKSGATQLADGTVKLQDGLKQLQDGSGELSSKLGDASKQASDLKSGDKQTEMFADPIGVTEHKLTDVPNYGTGMTPYFLALGLYVGVLMSTVILPLRDAAGVVKSGWCWYLSKLLLFAPIVVLQTVLVDTVLIAGLGLKVPHVAAFYGITAVIGLTFMAIVQFLVTLADTIGRFLAIVLLTLQLASSAGTYPTELLPAWLQHISGWMPMTHAIEALRVALSNGPASRIGEQLLLMAVYAVAFAAFTVVLFAVRRRRAASDEGSLYLAQG
ncbi:YhgE/Pip domain-containing protein [Cohnella nanjingensis]|uniref:YhgE/Pip domain-containing protein n=1 Tax=Cohnella nanjingensis TaxID=1387779 RepID=A0A7X0RQA6_9BACL|nr:YhgE/Pip domain-containing protein [Cohnella nanjingensis]MBB6671742.1 YhgE/Pip domain-containing protein [Cohnella nanjingensis]